MKKLISRRNFLKMGALASAVMMLAACGGGAGGGKDAGANVDVTGAVSFPLAEQVTFTGMTSYPVAVNPIRTTVPFSNVLRKPPMYISTGRLFRLTSGAIKSP